MSLPIDLSELSNDALLRFAKIGLEELSPYAAKLGAGLAVIAQMEEMRRKHDLGFPPFGMEFDLWESADMAAALLMGFERFVSLPADDELKEIFETIARHLVIGAAQRLSGKSPPTETIQ